MRVQNLAYIPTQVASAFIHIESYTNDSNLIISKADNDATFIGRAYEMSPLTGGGKEFVGLIQNLFKMAPDDSLVQVSLINCPDYEVPYIMTKGKTFGNELLQELINRQAQHYQRAAEVDFLYNMPAVNKKTVVVSFMTPVKTVDDKALETALDTQNEFLSGLKYCGFYDAHTLTPGNLLSVYRLFANIYAPREKVQTDEMLDLRQQAFGPDNIFDFRPKDYALLNKKIYCAAVVPKALPLSVSNGLMNLLIGAPLNNGSAKDGGGLRVKTPFIFTATVRVANQRKEIDRIRIAIKSRSNHDKPPITLGTEDREGILEDLNYLQKTCSDGTNKFTYGSVTGFVFGKTKAEMVAARSAVKTTFNNLDFDARDVEDTIGPRFAQALPLNYSLSIAKKLENEAIMPASAASCLLPIFGDYLGNADLQSARTGICYLTRRGSAYYHDIFRTNGNKNGILCAKSGAGKSAAAQFMMTSELASGSKVYFFDNGKSTKKYCKSVDGEYIEFGLSGGHRPSLNPFTGLTENEFEEQADTIAALILKMAYFNEPQEPGARIAVSEAVKAAYGQKRGRADIKTVIASLQNIKESNVESKDKTEVVVAAGNLIPRLISFVDSPARGAFFLGESSLKTNKQLTVFELSALDGDEHLKQCVLFFVLNGIMNTVKNTKGKKLVMLDEAWQIIRDEGAASVMEGLYRKARKDDGSIWVITQSPRDLSGNPTGEVILSQSSWKLVMEQEPEEIDKIVKEGVMTKFKDDPYFAKVIKDIRTEKGKYSEILICGESSYEAVRLYIDRFTGALYASDSEERDAVFQLMNEGMSAVDAVNAVIGNTETKRKQWIKEIVSQLRRFEHLTDAEIKKEMEEAMNE